MQYEHIFLPAKMFEGGKEFMDRLADEKEKLIDELYEEAYQQKRMYPYMEEDFSVMSMQISDTLNVTRVDFPTRDMAPNCAIRAYLVWDDAASQGRYFVIDARPIKLLSWLRLQRITSVLDMELHRLRVLSFRLFLTWLRKVQRNRIRKVMQGRIYKGGRV